jgi:hypothetical protein
MLDKKIFSKKIINTAPIIVVHVVACDRQGKLHQKENEKFFQVATVPRIQ